VIWSHGLDRLQGVLCLTPCIVRQLTGEKVTNKCAVIVYIFLKCIYLFIAPTCFGCSLAIIRMLVIWYNAREQCVYLQDTIIYISVLQFKFTIC
jgi:hypothetical protein